MEGCGDNTDEGLRGGEVRGAGSEGGVRQGAGGAVRTSHWCFQRASSKRSHKEVEKQKRLTNYR